MKTEQEIREMIKYHIRLNQYLLNMPPATVLFNAPRALMQLAAIVKLETLYDVLNEERPRFIYDKERS